MSIFYEGKQIIDANLDFLFLMQMPFIEMQMQNIHMMHMFSFQRCNSHDADVPGKGADAKFIHDGASAHIQSWCKCLFAEMEMQKCLVVQMPSNGHVMM